jgi:prolipoprotein diacylglyceryl transferase
MIWNIQPEIFSFSPVPRWYSICFALGVLLGHTVTKKLTPNDRLNDDEFNSAFVYVIMGMMIGMRLAHCLFYQPEYYFERPWEIPMLWQGGYASHGGFLGVFIAVFLFLQKHPKINLLWFLDRVIVGCACAAGWIRVGNFFNSEMIGRETDVPWAITFAQIDQIPRHPTQLYEAVGYFVICAFGYILFKKSKIAEHDGRMFGLIVILAALWRIFCEFFKIEQVDFEKGMFLNMGQILSLPFIILGLWLLFRKPNGTTAKSA